MISYFGVGAFFVLQALSVYLENLPFFILMRFCSGSFAGASTVVKAYIADEADPKDLPKWMAHREAAATCAFIVGPLLGGYILELAPRGGLEAVLLLIGTSSFLAALLVFRLRPRPSSPIRPHQSSSQRQGVADTASAEGSAPWVSIFTIIGVTCTYNFGQSFFDGFFPVLFSQRFSSDGRHLGLVQTSLAALVFVVTYFAYTPLVRRFRLVHVAVAGLFMIGLGVALLGVQLMPHVVAAGVLLYAVGVPLYAPSVPTMMARCAPRQKRGLVMGAESAVNSLARIASPVLLGHLYEASPEHAFLLVGMVVMVGALAMASKFGRSFLNADAAVALSGSSGEKLLRIRLLCEVRASGRGCITGNTILRNGAGGLLVESSRRAVTTIVRNRVWANSGCDLRQSPTSTGLLAGKAAAVTLANTVGHQDSPSASHGTELTAIWPQRVVTNSRDLRAAVREAPSDGFTFLQLQGKVVLEEPLLLDKPVILAGESLTGDSGSIESRGELHGPPGGSAVIVETAESCALWRLNLILSPTTPASCVQVETGCPVLVDCDLQVHGVQLDGSVPTHCIRAAGAESKLLLIGCSLAGATGNGLLLVDGASASMVRCQVKSNRQGGVFLADGASLLAESSDISRNGHFGVVAGSRLLVSIIIEQLLRQMEVEDIVNIHADSDDYVTEVVDVTGGSDEEDLVEVKAGEPPRYFHGYRRGRELGRGASGQVFVCHKKGTEGGFAAGFAVKAVDLRRLHLQPNAEREEKKLSREVEILKRLPPLVDTFEEGEWFLLVLELVGGGDLYTVLTNREPPRLHEREAAFVLAQLAGGLAFLHGQGVIHRDMKLENVLVHGERRERPLILYTVKITDFGLSKAIGAGFSEARSTVGTRPYTAPEVLREDSHDFSSDLWCLGVLLFVLLAGHFPFSKIPFKQEELQMIVGKLKISDTSKSVVLGLLQLEPRQRTDLATLSRHEWLCYEVESPDEAEKSDKPKRTRSVSASPSMRPIAPQPSLTGQVGQVASVPAKKPTESPAETVPNESSVGHTAKAEPGAVVPEPPPPTEQGPVSPVIVPPRVDVPQNLQIVPKRSISMITTGEVSPPSSDPAVMQLHLVVPDRLAGTIMGKSGPQLKQISSTLGCQVRMISRKTVGQHRIIGHHRIVIFGTYNQCVIVQELVHGRLMDALRAEGKEPTTETAVVLFVRAEAAGMVIGKQGWVLKQIRKQSNAKIQLLREEVRGQRPCIIEGELQSIIRAEKHVFDLVAAVQVVPPNAPAPTMETGQSPRWTTSGPYLPRTRISAEPLTGKVVFWKGQVGWIEPEHAVNHPKAYAHKGSGSLLVGRTDLTGNDAGSLWQTGGDASSSLAFLDQCSVSGSTVPAGNMASPAVVLGAIAKLVLWDCFAPTMRNGTLAAALRAEAGSRATVAGDGPTLGWSGWMPRSRTTATVDSGPAVGAGSVAWLDVSGAPVLQAKPSTAAKSRPSSASTTPSRSAGSKEQRRPRSSSAQSQSSDLAADGLLDAKPKKKKKDRSKGTSGEKEKKEHKDAEAKTESAAGGESGRSEEPTPPWSAEEADTSTVVDEVSEAPDRSGQAAEEGGHDAWLRTRMERSAGFGTEEGDRWTLFEILEMLATKDNHKEEVLDSVGLSGQIKPQDTVYLRGHTGRWMAVKDGTQVLCNAADRAQAAAFVVEFKGPALKNDCRVGFKLDSTDGRLLWLGVLPSGDVGLMQKGEGGSDSSMRFVAKTSSPAAVLSGTSVHFKSMATGKMMEVDGADVRARSNTEGCPLDLDF
ncbi:hypothetical protein AK812_SmicGene35894 [Symbiodinium microadriaticum]|uniref:Uncharacterized protein n=1 Tax=Symbiodinium microadriaticum TaxID=2951 RepID=A0A1Q9CKA9_SYMMI|nr:hypothetical protein AK812_SmicGene35894 [Symbiodinium microadriaticum]